MPSCSNGTILLGSSMRRLSGHQTSSEGKGIESFAVWLTTDLRNLRFSDFQATRPAQIIGAFRSCCERCTSRPPKVTPPPGTTSSFTTTPWILRGSRHATRSGHVIGLESPLPPINRRTAMRHALPRQMREELNNPCVFKLLQAFFG